MSALIDPVMKLAARAWLQSFKNKPIITLISTVLTISILGTGIYFADERDRAKREKLRLQDLQYDSQINQLKETEKNIKHLLKFIDFQKTNLRETQDAIEGLKEERKKLKPLVESDKAVVEAVFKAQEERQRKNIWRERWIGFAFGLVASLLASFLWFLIRLGTTRSPNEPS